MCVGFRNEILLTGGRGENVKPRENLNFMKNGKMIILVKFWNFFRSRMIKRTSLLESSHEI